MTSDQDARRHCPQHTCKKTGAALHRLAERLHSHPRLFDLATTDTGRTASAARRRSR